MLHCDIAMSENSKFGFLDEYLDYTGLNTLTSQLLVDVSNKHESLHWTLNGNYLPFTASKNWMEKTFLGCELNISKSGTRFQKSFSMDRASFRIRNNGAVNIEILRNCMQGLRTYIYVTLTLIFVVLTLFTSYIYYKEVLQVEGEIEQVEKDPLLLPFLTQLSSALIRIETMSRQMLRDPQM